MSRVLYVAPPDGPDFALLELKPRDDLPFPPPLQLERERPKADQAGRAVYVVGHPFFDARTPVELFNVIYATPLGVKHFAPGEVMGLQRVDTDSEAPTVRWALTHDCSTGGGDAGAPLIDLESGKVLGMHYGGEYRVANYAVPVWAALGDPRVQGLAPIRQILKEK